MSELEATIEKKLIEKLCYGESQWTYREDLRTEQDLWKNFKYILEQNNKAKLNDVMLSDSEFEQVKNQLQFSSFYDAGSWLVGEQGIVYVHVQRGNETLHLTVLNQEHISGGTSVYEVINQYQALKDDSEEGLPARDRRFDVTLMINGLPMIHIELKNREHSYMEGFWQIKKYIAEGKFKGIFSAVQMFVVSNAVDTRYFSAARDTELNPKFMSCWLDHENKPVSEYLDFAGKVLKIPEAHEMVSKYTVLDKEAKRLLLLRPYQIHAIEAMREASKKGICGYIWHTTGSGKTMTSYKATRNLLMDIPAIEKTIFLIDRKDLDTQTSQAFQSYAGNDVVDVDETDNVTDLIKKLSNKDRQMIVTTIQKMQIMINKRLTEDHPKYQRIKSLKIAFVVDECHRSVTPSTKREFEKFFLNSLWYGFTGTPRFSDNAYPALGDLPRTTKQLYGECLHKYTIKEAIHDKAVLGFMTEHLIDKGLDPEETDPAVYESESHMLNVLNTILNKSYHKLGMDNGRGTTYEAILTTSSIKMAQKYYELLKAVKNGEKGLQISEEMKKVLPDFPKFAITYSVTENEEGSTVNQEKMQESLDDYNRMFGTHYDTGQITAYNSNLNDRLSRKKDKFKSRSEQLDLVIVVDRLLTGFDAPCLSTLYMDRQPMQLHDIIQAFSRTNRIFDAGKQFGQIVTFQSPKAFKTTVDDALKLFSAGGLGEAVPKVWEEVEPAFVDALKALREIAAHPEDVPGLSEKEKKRFAKSFQGFDSLLAQLKAFTNFEGKDIGDYGITEQEYEDYAAHYRNILDDIHAAKESDPESEDPLEEEDPSIALDPDYELMAFSKATIDYEYILNLIQNIVTSMDEETEDEDSIQKKLDEVHEYVNELKKVNPKIADIMIKILSDLELDRSGYHAQSVSEKYEALKKEAMDSVIDEFSRKWFVDRDAVRYAVQYSHDGEVPNSNVLKETARYGDYKENTEDPAPKFTYRSLMIKDLGQVISEEILPLRDNI